ncbi:DUF3558 family protein [Actinokineospora sp.]|uniref:DUF3558 family protein n=1 Tax=Actinokineospora sp. TaxID=1872133 RepID=UPI004037D843
MRRRLAAVLVGVAAVSGCGGGSTAAPSTSEQSVVDVDPCGLLKPEEVRAYLPEAKAPSRGLDPHREDGNGLPRCVWGDPAEGRSVTLLIVPPPQDEVVKRTSDKLEIAGRPGYKKSAAGSACWLYVEAGPALVGFDAKPPSGVVEDTCKAAADTLSTVLTRLGW